MPSVKCTFIFQAGTAPSEGNTAPSRAGGFTETWWFDGTLANAKGFCQRLAPHRASLLPKTAAIVGYRVQELGGAATSSRYVFPGNNQFPTGLPQKALQVSWGSEEGPNKKESAIHCIPDQFIVGGEFQPNADYRQLLVNYNTECGRNNAKFMGVDMTKPFHVIQAITAEGLVQLETSIGDARPDYVQVYRATNTLGRSVSGVFRVTAFTGGMAFAIGGWAIPHRGAVTNRGKMRIYTRRLFQINEASFAIQYATVRKIGRPSVPFRGRSRTRA